jgi:microcin C transport system permease protein
MSKGNYKMNPTTKRRLTKFKNNKRAFFSLILFATVFLLSLPAEFIANDKPLVLSYKGELYFPIFKTYSDKDFGGTLPTPADYQDTFTIQQIENSGWMIMPPIPYSYDTINYNLDIPSPAPPSVQNILGTDDQGRDVAARLIYGLRISLLFGLILTVVSSVIGVIAGAVQGYFGGKIDLFMQRFMEIWGGMPQLFILIIVASVFIPSFFTLLAVMLLFSWTALVGVVRAEFMRTRNFEYVTAAKALGVSNTTIIFRHILPNALVATITYLPFIMCGAVVALTSLDFLGLGLPPGEPSLGELLRQGKDNIEAVWLGLSGFFVLAVTLSLLVFIGEGVRDAFNAVKE